MIARAALFALQALGEYGALTGGGATGTSSAAAWVRGTVEFAFEHKVALGIVAAIAFVWIVFPTRSPD